MGCYDTIIFKCPNCGADLEAQSKSGKCVLNTYDYHAVPADVANDANRHAPFHCDCGKSWGFKIPDYQDPPKLWLDLVEVIHE